MHMNDKENKDDDNDSNVVNMKNWIIKVVEILLFY